MGKHNDHLPRNNDNKGTHAKSDSKTLERLAKAQGQGTKQDAKDAKGKG